jgi:ArsR family transcriptional regulator
LKPYTQIANLLKALAHPARIRIMRALAAEGEACVCHLEARLDLRQAYLSQQLARLRQAGLVDDRKDGLNVYYAVSDPTVLELLEKAVEMAPQDLSIGQADAGRGSNQDCPCPKCAGESNDAV